MKKCILVSMVCAVSLGVYVSRADEGYHEEDEFDFARELTSLGQLCKLSDVIAVGKLKGKKTKADGDTEYTFSVERVLDGNARAKTFTAHGNESPLHAGELRNITTNLTYAFFGIHKYAVGYPTSEKLLSLSFEKDKPPNQVSKWFFTHHGRGVIPITAENVDAYEEAIKGHLKHIRSKNVFDYFVFLRGLSKSNIERIKRDALEDLHSLVRFSASEDDLAKMLENPRLTDEDKTVIQASVHWHQEKKRIQRERAEAIKKTEEK